MSYTVTEYADVSARAEQLQLQNPTDIAVLPRNFHSAGTVEELVHESAVQTVRKLFRANGIVETPLENPGQRLPCIQENEFALVLPTIFVGVAILSQNPHLVSVALNVVGNYATDFFKGIVGRKKAVIDIVVQESVGNSYKKIHYEGDPDGMKELAGIVGKVFKNEK